LCKLGPADVLPKPYDLHMLGTRIRRILDGNKEA
jgi:hypothetical protein